MKNWNTIRLIASKNCLKTRFYYVIYYVLIIFWYSNGCVISCLALTKILARKSAINYLLGKIISSNCISIGVTAEKRYSTFFVFLCSQSKIALLIFITCPNIQQSFTLSTTALNFLSLQKHARKPSR